MLGFFLKRRFVTEVQAILSKCFADTSQGTPSFGGFTLNKSDFVARIDRWLVDETAKLDTQQYGAIAETGDATQRCRVWVGVRLASWVYKSGGSDVPKDLISRFWRPANIVSNLYFENLRTHTETPFSLAYQKYERELAGTDT